MSDKPTTAAGYKSEHLEYIRSSCLYLATKLGDIMDDLVVVGGLVPSLLIEGDNLPAETDAHCGTMDLDVGLSVALLNEDRYSELADRLRRAGFRQDVNEADNLTRQYVGVVCRSRVGVALDIWVFEDTTSQDYYGERFFLVPPLEKGARGICTSKKSPLTPL